MRRSSLSRGRGADRDVATTPPAPRPADRGRARRRHGARLERAPPVARRRRRGGRADPHARPARAGALLRRPAGGVGCLTYIALPCITLPCTRATRAEK